MTGLPRVTFGIIVLNGEPFTAYCLRALYPFAHEIVVVEGACETAAEIATPDGHSTDGTLETLYRFKADEDPEGKLQIVTREGFWREKDEQSQAYAKRATGDYLWQVDIDEFYRAKDMLAVFKMLRGDPQITAVSFKQITFWGGLDYFVDGWYLRRGADIYHRLFKWGSGYRYVAHRPPTVCDPQGRDLRTVKWMNGYELGKRDIKLYHYSLLFPKQVMEKAKYYAAGSWGEYSDGVERWAHENFLTSIQRPFQLHNFHSQPSWIKRFHQQHPDQIKRMQDDIENGRLQIACRDNSDVEAFVDSRLYRFESRLLELLTPLCGFKYFPRWRLTKYAHQIAYDYGAKHFFIK